MGRSIYQDEHITVPEDVSVSIKARHVVVKGPRGTLEKNLRHIDMDIRRVGKDKIRLVVWHGSRKHIACLRTVASLIENMIIGVTKVRRYREYGTVANMN